MLSVSVGISLTHQRLMVVTLGDSVNIACGRETGLVPGYRSHVTPETYAIVGLLPHHFNPCYHLP